jgi:hypothetical protein
MTSAAPSELERIVRFLYDQVSSLRQASVVTGLSGQAQTALFVYENFVFGSKGGPVLTAGRYGGLWWKGNGTILGWIMAADVTGSVTLDVRKSNWTTYPVVTSICGGSFPKIQSDIKAKSVSVGTWTTPLTTDDWLEFWITGTPANISEVTLGLAVVR